MILDSRRYKRQIAKKTLKMSLGKVGKREKLTSPESMQAVLELIFSEIRMVYDVE